LFADLNQVARISW